MAERLSFAVPEQLDGERLDRVVAVLGGMSRAAARTLVDEGDVTVDGQRGEARRRLTAGQTVAFDPVPPLPELAPEEVAFGVVYEDGDVVVVDKPPGLVVHPGAGRAAGTLANGILARFPQVEGVGDADRWGLVHRLDRDTSGLLVVALNEAAFDSLRSQISARQVERTYLALVDGVFSVPTGTIDAPIERDPDHPTRRRVGPEGRPARTHYSVRETFEASGVSLVEVSLETGRTHQIRVHFAAIDHPLVGDSAYRGRPDHVETPRLFLHAHRLAFTHPRTGERVEVESPLPADLAAALSALRR